jgi:O-antigen/teichoic acid export membrane protein
MPASFGVAFVAQDLVALLLGDQWSRATVMLEYLAPAAGIMVILSATNAYAMAQGRARLIFARETAVFLIRTPLFITATVFYGLFGAALAAAASLLLISALNAGLYARLSERSALEPFWRARRSFLGVAAMAGYFFLLRDNLAIIDMLPLALRLGADVLAGIGLYLGALLVTWRVEGAPPGIEQLAMERLSAIWERRGETIS